MLDITKNGLLSVIFFPPETIFTGDSKSYKALNPVKFQAAVTFILGNLGSVTKSFDWGDYCLIKNLSEPVSPTP